MNRYLLILVFTLFIGCDDIGLQTPHPCRTSTAIAVTADDEPGTIRFDDRFAQYVIKSAPSFPNIDTQWTHLVCDLAEEFQVEGLQVVFSGTKRNFNENEIPNMLTGGEEFFTVVITKLEKLN